MFGTKSKNLCSLALTLLVFATACKPQTDANEASSSKQSAETAPQSQQGQEQSGVQKMSTKARTGLTLTQWLTKQNISVEEGRTVDAIIANITEIEMRKGEPAELARWADKNLQVLALDDKNLTDISPILTLKNISTLSIVGNKFTQTQVDELVTGLPKLRNLVTDRGVSCRANPKVTCLQ